MPSWKRVIISGSDAALNSLNVSTSLTASGIIYPTTDGTSGQVVITDGNGNLSFSNIENTTISIKNMSGGTIAKGTPCYITGSGTSGNLAGVFPADASNPLRMPAGVIAGETLTAGAEGIGLINGFISGVNTSAFAAGDSVYVAVGGGYTNVKPTGSSVLIQKLGNVEKSHASNGSGVINGPGYYNEVPNIQQGFTWVGNGNGVATPVATSSIQNVVSSSYALAAATASFVTTAQTASFVTGSNVFGPFGSNSITSASFAVSSSRAVTASFATTASYALTAGSTAAVAGTTNYVSKFTSGTTIGNSVIYDNGTNVGIGTTSPGNKLVVQGNITVRNSSGFDRTVIGIDASSSSPFVTLMRDSDTTVTVRLDSNSDSYFTGGNVGIGTTSPTAKLHVSGSTIITGTAAIGTGSLGASENTLTLGARDTGGEGGQLGFNASGGTYTSASMIDNYNNSFRILKGTNAGSTGLVAQWNLHNTQMQLPGYTSPTSMPGTVSGLLAFDTSGNIITTATGSGGGGVTINNNTDNYIVTATGTTNTLNGESGLQYNGTSLTVTGQVTASGAIISNANGAMYFRGGDDAEFWDINVLNTVGIYGQQTQAEAGLKLGSSGATLYGSGSRFGINTTTPTSASLTVNGNVWATSFTGSLFGTASWATNSTTATQTSQAVTFNNGGSGDASGTSFNGSTARTISYNTVGAPSISGTNATGTWGISITGTAATASFVTGSNVYGPFGSNSIISASFAVSSSRAVSSSFATTASYATTAGSVGSISANITNNTDNYVLTATGGSTVNGEANLTFDGTVLSANKVRLGRDWSLSNRGTIRIDSNGTSYPADILFGHTAAANETGWDGVYWSLSSRAGDSSNRFYIYRGAGNPGGSGEGVVFALDPNGNAGIGATSPSTALHIARTAAVSPTIRLQTTDSTTNGAIQWTNSTNTMLAFIGSNANVGDSSGNLEFATGGSTTRMVINSAGNISVGTSATSITGTTFRTLITSGDSRVMAFNGASNSSVWWNGGGTPQFAIDSISGGGANFWTNDGSWSERMRITSAGNVGIGTTAPAARLDVSVGQEVNGYSLSGYPFLKYSAGDVLDYGAFGATWTALRFLTNGSERMRITAAGNVGIGTTSPSTKLHVSGAGAFGGIIYPDYNTDTGTRIDGATVNQLKLYADSYIVGLVGSSERFACSTSQLYTAAGINLSSGGRLYVTTVDNASTDTDKFLVLNGTEVEYRTGTQLLSDIGAAATSHTHTLGYYSSAVESNLDTLYSTGQFGFSNTTTGRPENYGQGINIVSSGTAHNGVNNWISQLAFGTNGNTAYFRTKVNAGGWNSWYTLYHNGNLTNPVTGTGANQRVALWSGTTTQTSNANLTFDGTTFNVGGTLTATVKSFIIDHPTKQGKKLQYGVLEGPEHSVYVRGKLTNNNTIILPDHWHALVHEDTITVNLTPIGKRQDLWVETVTDTAITVGSDNEINCFYTVFAERKDIEKLVTEFDK